MILIKNENDDFICKKFEYIEKINNFHRIKEENCKHIMRIHDDNLFFINDIMSIISSKYLNHLVDHKMYYKFNFYKEIDGFCSNILFSLYIIYGDDVFSTNVYFKSFDNIKLSKMTMYKFTNKISNNYSLYVSSSGNKSSA